VSASELRQPGCVSIESLPQPSDARIAVRVSRPGLRAIRSGSPWLFDQAVESHKPTGSMGDLAVIFDEQRRFAAIGLWDPESPIRVKVLHVGKPVNIDASWWQEKMTHALDLRRDLLSDGSTTGFRWVHGENDGLAGLIVDQYSSTVVIKIYTGAWFVHLAAIIQAIVEIAAVDRIVIRFSRLVRDGETYGLVDGDTLYGEAPTGPVMFLENGLTLEADVVLGHKTGHFLDQRDNRAIIGNLASGCSVLDVFSSTGGFTLAAAAGGAKSVHMALEDMVEQKRTFDIVILDPPSFAQNQASVIRALSSYERLAKLGMRLTAPGGTLLQASCSSRVTIEELADAAYLAARSVHVDIDEFRRTEHAVDHPIGFEFGAYLKAIYYKVTPYGV
jgi:23S rRNA (cytosine1962-C5)-methyltransferase